MCTGELKIFLVDDLALLLYTGLFSCSFIARLQKHNHAFFYGSQRSFISFQGKIHNFYCGKVLLLVFSGFTATSSLLPKIGIATIGILVLHIRFPTAASGLFVEANNHCFHLLQNA